MSVGAVAGVRGDRGDQRLGGVSVLTVTAVAGAGWGVEVGAGSSEYGDEADLVGVGLEVDGGAGGQVAQGVVDDQEAQISWRARAGVCPRRTMPGPRRVTFMR